MHFLSAEWKHLLLANYVVEPDLLAPFVPGETSIGDPLAEKALFMRLRVDR